VHATFYVNTGFIGDSTHMTWSLLQSLFAAGNDVGGHTLTHTDLKKLKTTDATYQVCQDRDNLINNGLQPVALRIRSDRSTPAPSRSSRFAATTAAATSRV
jgi:peptidoglycan/xylan/chitin deacetylase (PgdA/CDA1 family)